ncbi:hypothetical protein [Borrelia persica]|uniref:hypothetical protein n=1 Tax=Borrelia persica TaxID=44448 RepID=UPI0004657E9F|nr:hypothetical protein [Borrelia persica]
MIKVESIQLYKLGEVVKILKENFNFKIDKPTLCRKLTKLNAYVIYNEKKYIPEDIICHLTTEMRYLEIRINTKKIVENKIKSIKQKISIYDQKNKIPSIEAIQQIKTNNSNTTKLIKAFLELQEKIQHIEEKTQKEIQHIEEKTQKEIQHIEEKTQKEIQHIEEKTQKEIQHIEEKTRKEIKNKDEEISELKQKIQNIEEEKQTQIKLIKGLIDTSNNSIYKESKKNNCYIKKQKNI